QRHRAGGGQEALAGSGGAGGPATPAAGGGRRGGHRVPAGQAPGARRLRGVHRGGRAGGGGQGAADAVRPHPGGPQHAQDGRPVAAVSEVQRREVTGLAAFVRMMVATTAHGTFAFGPLPPAGPGGLNVSMEDLILRTCETLNGAEARANVQRLESTTEFDV